MKKTRTTSRRRARSLKKRRVTRKRIRKSGASKYTARTALAMAPAPKHSNLCKSLDYQIAMTAKDSRTLYSAADISQIPRQSNSDTYQYPSRRTGAQADIRGWRIKICVKNLAVTAGSEGVLNWAILQPVNNAVVTTSGFFRDHGNSVDIDFTNALFGMTINYESISTDRFIILRHKRCRLGPLSNANTTCPSTKFFKEWVPFNRTIRYNDDSDQLAENLVFFVYWFDFDDAQGNSVPLENAWAIAYHHTVFFRDTPGT